MQIRAGSDRVNGSEAIPTHSHPPLGPMTRPPARYALIHTNEYILGDTPLLPNQAPPGGIYILYIFFGKDSENVLISFKLKHD